MKLNARQKAYDPAVLTSSSTAATAVEWYKWRRMVHMTTTNTHTYFQRRGPVAVNGKFWIHSAGPLACIPVTASVLISVPPCLTLRTQHFSHTLYLGPRQSQGANWILHSTHISLPLQMCEAYIPWSVGPQTDVTWSIVFPNCIFPFHSRKAPTHCPYVGDLTWPDLPWLFDNSAKRPAASSDKGGSHSGTVDTACDVTQPARWNLCLHFWGLRMEAIGSFEKAKSIPDCTASHARRR